MRSRLILSITAATTMFAAVAFAQPPTTPAVPKEAAPSSHAVSHAMEKGGEGMMHHCDMMMSQQEIAKQMDAMDAKLQGLVETMNATTGPARVDAMAAVVNELVTQRTEMRRALTSMRPMMMHGSGMDNEGKPGMAEGMKDCPMMKEKGDAPSMPQHR
ncbi:MAG: hypothetical protein WBX15_18970 [Thermoanaerobaculia bacterium]